MKQFRTLFRFTAFIALLVIAMHDVHAQRAPVKVIKGIVVDSSTMAPLGTATITFNATGAGAGKTKTLKVHSDGRFRVRLSNHYFWDMTISAPGYESYTWKTVNGKIVYKGVSLVIALKKAG